MRRAHEQIGSLYGKFPLREGPYAGVPYTVRYPPVLGILIRGITDYLFLG